MVVFETQRSTFSTFRFSCFYLLPIHISKSPNIAINRNRLETNTATTTNHKTAFLSTSPRKVEIYGFALSSVPKRFFFRSLNYGMLVVAFLLDHCPLICKRPLCLEPLIAAIIWPVKRTISKFFRVVIDFIVIYTKSTMDLRIHVTTCHLVCMTTYDDIITIWQSENCCTPYKLHTPYQNILKKKVSEEAFTKNDPKEAIRCILLIICFDILVFRVHSSSITYNLITRSQSGAFISDERKILYSFEKKTYYIQN